MFNDITPMDVDINIFTKGEKTITDVLKSANFYFTAQEILSFLKLFRKIKRGPKNEHYFSLSELMDIMTYEKILSLNENYYIPLIE